MKKILLMMILLILVSTAGCSKDTPSIVMYGSSYFASNVPVNELPQDYTSSGTLTAEEANNTGLEGCEYFLNINYDSVPDIYVYQECGNPISENGVDHAKRQGAYMQWIKK